MQLLKENTSLSSLDMYGTTSHKAVRILCKDCGKGKFITLKCSDRTCEECRRRTYGKLLRGWKSLVEEMQHPVLLTVTLKNQSTLKKSEIKRIRTCFNRLLRRKYYKERIAGGLYSIEIKNKGQGAGWNVHIHALIDMTEVGYGTIPQKKLSEDWHSITKDSFIVDIRKAHNPEKGLLYILKYIVKTPEIANQNQTYNKALKGSRLVQTFGSFYRKKPFLPKACCEDCGSTNIKLLIYQNRGRSCFTALLAPKTLI